MYLWRQQSNQDLSRLFMVGGCWTANVNKILICRTTLSKKSAISALCYYYHHRRKVLNQLAGKCMSQAQQPALKSDLVILSEVVYAT